MTTTLPQVISIIPVFTMADRLRKARELTGMSIREFAANVGISDTTVTKYEHGYSTPRRVYLEAWARASSVNLVWLETGKEEAPVDETTGADVRPKGFEPPTF